MARIATADVTTAVAPGIAGMTHAARKAVRRRRVAATAAAKAMATARGVTAATTMPTTAATVLRECRCTKGQ
jgi:hypothetical protein